MGDFPLVIDHLDVKVSRIHVYPFHFGDRLDDLILLFFGFGIKEVIHLHGFAHMSEVFAEEAFKSEREYLVG